MNLNGKFRERLRNSWVEMRENMTRSVLQSLGVILGVAAVLGGFSISDSMRKRSMELYVRMGGLDKLNVQPSEVIKDGSPTALQMANLGLRAGDASGGGELDSSAVNGIFNVGTGKAESFRDMIGAMFKALGRAPNIEYIDMPETIRGQYQYFTQSKIENLRRAG